MAKDDNNANVENFILKMRGSLKKFVEIEIQMII